MGIYIPVIQSVCLCLMVFGHADNAASPKATDFLSFFFNSGDVTITDLAHQFIVRIGLLSTLDSLKKDDFPSFNRDKWNQMFYSEYTYDPEFAYLTGDFCTKHPINRNQILGIIPGKYFLAGIGLNHGKASDDMSFLEYRKECFRKKLLVDYCSTHLEEQESKRPTHRLVLAPHKDKINPLQLLASTTDPYQANLGYRLKKIPGSDIPGLYVIATRKIGIWERLLLESSSLVGGNIQIKNRRTDTFEMDDKQYHKLQRELEDRTPSRSWLQPR